MPLEKNPSDSKNSDKLLDALSQFSRQFINIDPTEIEEVIPESLEVLGNAAEVETVAMFIREEGQDAQELAYLWRKMKGSIIVKNSIMVLHSETFPWGKELYHNAEPILITNPNEDIPESANAELRLFKRFRLRSVAFIPILLESKVMGSLVVGTHRQPKQWTSNLIKELIIAGEILASALERKKKYEETNLLRQQVIDAEEKERRRISHELHDEFGGALTSLKMNIAALTPKTGDDPKATGVLRQMSQTIDNTMVGIRRICHDLDPVIFDDHAFHQILHWQSEKLSEESGIECEVSINVDNPPPNRRRDTTLFRILQELLTNVARHSNATLVKIQYDCTQEWCELRVSDNGVGFALGELSQCEQFGLRGLKYRVEQLKGSFDLTSGATGTSAHIRLPIIEKTPAQILSS